MKLIKIYCLFVIFSHLTGCYPKRPDKRLRLLNNSTKSIYWSPSLIFPDTLDPSVPVLSLKQNLIHPNTNNALIFSSLDHIFSYDLPSKKLQIFLYDSVTIATVPPDTIRKKSLYLKRYVLTLDSIYKLNFQLHYP
jgi:hypothetical protein